MGRRKRRKGGDPKKVFPHRKKRCADFFFFLKANTGHGFSGEFSGAARFPPKQKNREAGTQGPRKGSSGFLLRIRRRKSGSFPTDPQFRRRLTKQQGLFSTCFNLGPAQKIFSIPQAGKKSQSLLVSRPSTCHIEGAGQNGKKTGENGRPGSVSVPPNRFSPMGHGRKEKFGGLRGLGGFSVFPGTKQNTNFQLTGTAG